MLFGKIMFLGVSNNRVLYNLGLRSPERKENEYLRISFSIQSQRCCIILPSRFKLRLDGIMLTFFGKSFLSFADVHRVEKSSVK